MHGRANAPDQQSPSSLPKLPIDLVERNIAQPLVDDAFVEVPATPLFVKDLPVVDRIMDYTVGTDTHNRTKETLIRANTDAAGVLTLREKIRTGKVGIAAVRIASGGRYPHNRSINWMEAEHPEIESMVIKGKEYSGISSKGVDYYLPRIAYDEHYPGTSARINGLMTADFAERTVKVSNWLLKEGLDSEVVWSVSRPEQFPWTEVTEKDGVTTYRREEALLSSEEFKKRLLQRAQMDNAHLPAARRVDVGKMRQHLEKTDLVVVNRATTVPFRLSDLAVPFQEAPLPHSSPNTELMFMLNRTFAYLNHHAPESHFNMLQTTHGLTPQERELVVAANNSEVDKFFDYFTSNLAHQIGELHNKGVAHGFLHGGNITVDGTFVDIDSLHGSPLGDAAITEKNIVRDVAWAIRSVRAVLDELSGAGAVSLGSADVSRNFLRKYMLVRWGDASNAASRLSSFVEQVVDYVPEETIARKKQVRWYDIPGKLHVMDERRQNREYQRWARRELVGPLREEWAGRRNESLAA